MGCGCKNKKRQNVTRVKDSSSTIRVREIKKNNKNTGDTTK